MGYRHALGINRFPVKGSDVQEDTNPHLLIKTKQLLKISCVGLYGLRQSLAAYQVAAVGVTDSN